MSERGMNPFVKAFIYFIRSFKPKKSFKKFVGEDHLGNKYYEIQNDPNRGTIRSFESVNIDDWDELPPEWNAWLRKRRMDPPTIEESMKNLQRIDRFKLKDQQQKQQQTKIETNFPKFDEYEKVPGSKYKSN